MILDELASDAVLDEASAWLCHRRRRFPHNAEVWTFLRGWTEEKPRLQADLLAQRYRFQPLYRVTLADDGEVDVWRRATRCCSKRSRSCSRGPAQLTDPAPL